jgi:prepilin-type N-terminal cleavage/methylation domain-containing protein
MSNEGGFTLAELLVTCAIVGLVMGGVFTLQQQGQFAYVTGAVRAETQQNARIALDRMIRELRSGTQVSAATNCDRGTNDLTFIFIDANAVSVTARYFLSGTSLMRSQTVPAIANQPETLIGGVQALTIVCYDLGEVATATLANVRSVDVALTTQGEDTSRKDQARARVNVASRVRMRNI